MSKSQDVVSGYRYYLGMLLGLCKGPVDRVRAIRVADRIAWSIDDGSTRDLRTEGLDPYSAAALGLIDAGGNITGAGNLVPEQLGAFAGVACTAAVGEASQAIVTIPGTAPGVKLGRSYDVALQTDGVTRTVIVERVTWSSDTDVTRWYVTPPETAWDAQAVSIQTTVLPEAPPPATSGAYGGGIHINRPDLLGGDEREGGIVGDIDVMMGRADQGQNDYLVSQLGADRTLGYRGILSLVLRHIRIAANNYYIKPWAVQVEHVLEPCDGSDDWYPEKAQIWGADAGHGQTITLISDTHVGADDAAGIAAGVTVDGLDPEIEYRVALVSGAWSPWGSPALTDDTSGAVTAFRVARGGSSSAVVSGGSSVPRDGYAAAAEAYQPIWISGSSSYTFYLVDDPSGDNTGTMVLRLERSFVGPDMNPAHAVRIIMMTRRDGKRAAAADLDEDSYTAAADTLHAEGLGVSFLWDGTDPDGVLGELLSTIDAAHYRDVATGKWVLKLIRADYDVGDLPVLDDSNVVDWGRLGQSDPGQMVNRVTVTYRDAETDERATVSVTDLAGLQAMGEVIEATPTYEMIRHRDLAARLAERDLRALGSALVRGDGITAFRSVAWDLSPGDAVVLNSPRHNLSNVVARVLEIGRGDIETSTVRLAVAEDVFATPSAALVGATAPSPDPSPVSLPLPPQRRLAVEAPYWAVVQALGHIDADAQLADDPDAGWVLAGAGLPSSSALSAQIWTRPGTTFALEAEASFSPTALLDGPVTDSPTETEIAITGLSLSADIVVGALAMVGDEIMIVQGVDPTGGVISVGRGALDTVPQAHDDGALLLVWPNFARLAPARRTAGEDIDVALLTRTSTGVLPLAAATVDTVPMDGRAIRPLPARRVQIDGSYEPDPAALTFGPIELTWAHRNRLTETGAIVEPFTAASTTNEAGVTYELEGLFIGAGDPSTWDVALTRSLSGSATSTEIAEADLGSPASGETQVRLSVWPVRDGRRARVARSYDLDIPTDSDALWSQVGVLIQGQRPDGSTDIRDLSSHAATVTRNGSPGPVWSDDAPLIGPTSVALSGSNWLSIPANANLHLGSADFAVDALIRPGTFALTPMPIACVWNTGGLRGWQLGLLTDGRLNFGISTDGATGTNHITTLTLSPGTDYALSVVRRGTDLEFWVDGVLEETFTVGWTVYAPAGVPLTVGRFANLAEFYPGFVQRLRVTTGAGAARDPSAYGDGFFPARG